MSCRRVSHGGSHGCHDSTPPSPAGFQTAHREHRTGWDGGVWSRDTRARDLRRTAWGRAKGDGGDFRRTPRELTRARPRMKQRVSGGRPGGRAVAELGPSGGRPGERPGTALRASGGRPGSCSGGWPRGRSRSGGPSRGQGHQQDRSGSLSGGRRRRQDRPGGRSRSGGLSGGRGRRRNRLGDRWHQKNRSRRPWAGCRRQQASLGGRWRRRDRTGDHRRGWGSGQTCRGVGQEADCRRTGWVPAGTVDDPGVRTTVGR